MSYNKFERKHAEGFYIKDDIEKLYYLQAGECYFCSEVLGGLGEKGAFHIDHLTPISKGGTNWPGNLALTCAFCNKRKHSHNTIKLWAKLKDEKGVDWVNEKIHKNKKNSGQKAKLTKLRKLKRKQSLSQFSQEIEVAISRCIKRCGYERPEEIGVSVAHRSYYVDIWFNNSCITLPAPTEKQLCKWHVDEFDGIAMSLLKIEYIAGYLNKAK